MRARAAWWLWATLAACAAPARLAVEPEPWPAADALFHSDPRWLGGDAVYSVDLGGDRILWLFGDSFVALDAQRDRRRSVMVRNTLAVQRGRDPTRATIAFHWQTADDGRPAAFFGDDGDIGYWPLHGIRLPNGPLLLFQTRVRNTPGKGLGFAIEGWRLVRVDDPDRDPQQWRWREVATDARPRDGVIGTAVWRDEEHVVALGTRGNGPHCGFLARFAIDPLRRDADGALPMQVWTDTGWQDANGHEPTIVLDDAGPECSLDRVPGGWRHVHSCGFGATTVAERRARDVTGPWSAPRDLFTPPQSRGERPFVYAAKAHPALDAGPGRVAIATPPTPSPSPTCSRSRASTSSTGPRSG
ncbi:MAG: DUF4185 domain-containing protein, partial [Planctomycetes bacterium]|nr:DUF4185 domain-containing protein [Planctomycetota bacterium]